jgi:hypothetical protein
MTSVDERRRRRRARGPRRDRVLAIRRRVVGTFDGEELAIVELVLEPDRRPTRRRRRAP